MLDFRNPFSELTAPCDLALRTEPQGTYTMSTLPVVSATGAKLDGGQVFGSNGSTLVEIFIDSDAGGSIIVNDNNQINFHGDWVVQLRDSSVLEPSSLALASIGAACVVVSAWRRHRRQGRNKSVQ
jgi:hypothetical protein